MKQLISIRKSIFLSVLLAAVVLAVPQFSRAATGAGADQDVASAVKSKLNKSQYKDVQVSVDANGIATLSGTVNDYEAKADADRTTHKVKGVTAVRNEISVSGPSVPDAQLQKSLAEKLTYDRVGYGNAFDAITVGVRDGVVTLGGSTHDYPNRDSAVGLVSTTPGVKDVVDNISVDPVSPMDDGIRLRVAQAVYSFPSLNKYAIDPAKPIRIAVQNGHVALYGEVDSQADKDAAGIRANSVAGVFSVKNDIQVAGQAPEHQ